VSVAGFGVIVKKTFPLLALVLFPAFLFAQQIPNSQSNNTGPEKFALVIGNGNYANIAKLNNPPNDANDMAATLQALGFTVEKVINGSLDQMESAVVRLENRLSMSKGSYGFFFYAGHGVQSNGENYLLPVDANIPGEAFLRQRAVSVQSVLSELNDAGNALNIVVLDACRDNPFTWQRSGVRGLAIINYQPADSIIVYATSAGSTAADGQGRNGLFTQYLLPNLKIPGLEIEEVFRKTMGDVARASGNQQRPAIYNQFPGTVILLPETSGSAGMQVADASNAAAPDGTQSALAEQAAPSSAETAQVGTEQPVAKQPSRSGLYFDVGLSFTADFVNINWDSASKDVCGHLIGNYDHITGYGLGGGLKIGYGPIGNIPVYAVAVVGSEGLSSDIIGYGFYGLGAIFYPIPLIQLGASLGVASTGYNYYILKSTMPENYTENDEKVGFGWNISAAVDLGKGNHGLLLGLQYIGAVTQFSALYWPAFTSLDDYKGYPINASVITTSFSIFVKYAYRKKLQ